MQIRREVEAKLIERKELETLRQHIPNWRKVFNQASIQHQKNDAPHDHWRD